ncbi:MAG: hypothetical protein IJD04_07180 [Desulfovibrionaceae bacterium]|nr:hypothetical protein [Desulfovibrionaceae bacterium]
MNLYIKTTVCALLILGLFVGLQSGSALAAEDEASVNQIQQTKADLSKLYAQLLTFKNNVIFHKEGLEEEDPESYQWLANVNAQEEIIDEHNGYPEPVKEAPEMLKDLAELYKENAGKETEDSRELRARLDSSLK